MKTSELRSAFLNFFESKGHAIVASSPVCIKDDPTLLFCNAGMNQFKNLFLGAEKRDYTRATSGQKCIRISGKHNDFENVGKTARHHTFFEMMGNFSFGDYFKADAIAYAWEFSTEILKLDKARLWVTIFETDDEAEELCLANTDIDKSRIIRLGEKDNFWSMGDTGPCGPCLELHYFLGDDVSTQSAEDFLKDDGTYVEFWNLVFMQYDRAADGTLTELPNPCIDTGMGLERVAALAQGKTANYDSDILRDLIAEVEKLSKKQYDGTSYEMKDLKKDKAYATDVAMRVIADHSRTAAFMIAEGVTPGSEGRSYILRRVMRRAIRHGRVLEFNEPFLADTTAKVIELMGETYPELVEAKEMIARVAHAEEKKFHETLDAGLAVLQKEAEKIKVGGTFPGNIAFLLHDTYGFPLDLTEDALLAYNLTVDHKAFEASMEAQRERSRSDRKGANITFSAASVDCALHEFTGYEQVTNKASLLHLVAHKEGQGVTLFFDRTPFYAESGGQVADTGLVKAGKVILKVTDVQKLASGHFAHHCELVEGELAQLESGASVTLEVDVARRDKIRQNHSATHLVHAALREVLGTHVKQAGSRVDDQTLRFDFSHFEPMTAEQLETVQRMVNQEIQANHPVVIKEMAIDEAKEKGAMALFGEKYGDVVRVVEIGPGSIELCGGTHVQRSGDIGFSLVTSEGGVAAGVRRIECKTGSAVLEEVLTERAERLKMANILKGDASEMLDKVEKLVKKNRELEKSIEELNAKVASLKSGEVADDARTSPAGIKVITKQLEEADTATLKTMVDSLRVKLGSGVVALGSHVDGKATLVAGVTADLTDKVHAGKLIKEASSVAGGRGGGRPDFAQAGGLKPEAIDAALDKLFEMVCEVSS